MADTTRRGPGRPPTGHAMAHLRARIPEELLAAARRLADRRAVKLSDVVRAALEREVRLDADDHLR